MKTLQKSLQGLPGGASSKEPTCQCRRCKRLGLDPWVGKLPWRRAQQSTPYPCPENPMDRGAWCTTAHRVAKNQTRLKELNARTHASRCTASYNTRGGRVWGRKRTEREPWQRSRRRTCKGKEHQLLTFSLQVQLMFGVKLPGSCSVNGPSVTSNFSHLNVLGECLGETAVRRSFSSFPEYKCLIA